MTGRDVNYSNYPRGFSHGLIVDNVPVSPGHPGKVFFVGNNSTLVEGEVIASNNNDGSFLRPRSTVDSAIGLCVANRGDVIYVRPNHTTTVSAADDVDADVAGISIIGMGNGTDQPRFDYTDGAGEIAIGASNVRIQNINFHANVDSVLIAIDIEDGVDNTTIRGCLFDVETTGTDEFDNAIALADNNIGTTIEGNEFDMGLGDAVRAIFMTNATGADEGTIIRNNVIMGDYSTANIGSATTASNDILIDNNLLINGETDNLGTVEVIELLTASSGTIRDNDCICNVATPDLAIVADTCMYFRNEYSETAGGPSQPIHGSEALTGGNTMVYTGTNTAASTTAPVIGELIGFGNDYFNDEYFMYVVKDAAGASGAPEGEYRLISDYVSSTGTFTVDAFGTALATGDEVLVIHKSMVNDLNSLSYTGTNTGNSTTAIPVPRLAGFGDDYFNQEWYLQIIFDVGGASTAPEGQIRRITDYVSATGTFTIAALANALTDGDKVTILHHSLVTVSDDQGRLSFSGTNSAASATAPVIAELSGLGNDFFNNEWYMEVIFDAAGSSAAPEGEVRLITDYVSTTGTFTVDTFSAALADGDKVAIIHRSILAGAMIEQCSVTSDAVMVNGDDIFTITGGPIVVTELVSECISVNDGTASTLQYQADPTVGSAATFSGASASLASAAAGAAVVLNKTALATAPDLIATRIVSLGSVTARDLIIGAGIIEIVIGTGSTTGTWRHHLRWKPLRPGVTVTGA